MNIKEYIKIIHNNNPLWFIDEVNHYENQRRIADVLKMKHYLEGKHAIMNRGVEMYNNRPYESRKVMLQYAKLIANLETSYLLKNPVTIVGKEELSERFKRVYKEGSFNKADYDLLSRLIKFGDSYEYIYIDNGKIKSKVIESENAFPIYNEALEIIAFVEAFEALESDFYIIYYPEKVEKWSNIGGSDLRRIDRYSNVSGLPIHYHNDNELDKVFGKSDLADFLNIIDNMEDLLSKFSDSFYKFHNPIPVVIGQQLKGEGINQNLVGEGLVLDDGSDFKMVSNSVNEKAFETIYKTLKQELLNISSTPAVSLNNTDVSNLSEVSMKLLFTLSDMKASMNERFLRNGFEKRFEIVEKLLDLQGQSIEGQNIHDLDLVFHYARPINEKDVIDNLKSLSEMGAISKETIIDLAPLLQQSSHEELRKINAENSRESNLVVE
ncbi:phage portal protein [Enterococcus sp. JM9B]|uniref:phage portal protein n=1 Tax=Enterococcus sp. JM9B TaxID=1857216 RepID=UPI001374B12C|nr:phage portal protein [Enterococcus sp. JM9B]KAF1304837.1 phage portal protein [Enterococcus sp. JM9B]